MEKIIVLLIAIIFLLSCQTVQQKAEPAVYYKRDMIITIDNSWGEGTLVVPKQNEYKIEIESKGDLDLFIIGTCHKEITLERAWDKGFFYSKRKLTFTYKPVPDFETTGSCPLQLGGIESTKGRHSWAIIDFESTEHVLPATIKCNGKNYNSNGTSICQTKQGLLEAIEFYTPVIISPDVLCPMPDAIDKMTFKFNVVGRECVYIFTEIAKPHRKHKLTTIGYEDVLIRSGE